MANKMSLLPPAVAQKLRERCFSYHAGVEPTDIPLIVAKLRGMSAGAVPLDAEFCGMAADLLEVLYSTNIALTRTITIKRR